MVISSDWFRDGSFFGSFYYHGDHSFQGYLPDRPLRNATRTQREVDGICRLLSLDPLEHLQILDAPCGYGRHLEAFAQRGYRMTGLDANEDFVCVATNSLESRKLQGEVRHGELRSLPFSDASFDLVLNLFFSFGFYSSDAENVEGLRELWRVLRPGGRLLFHTDVNVPLVAAGEYRQPIDRELEDGRRLLIKEEMDWNTRRLLGSWTISPRVGGNHTRDDSRSYSMRVYTFDEMRKLLEDLGAQTPLVFGSFDQEVEDYSEQSQEMIIVARKP